MTARQVDRRRGGRRVARGLAVLLYAVGGVQLGLGGILLIAEDPKWDPRMLLIGGVCWLAGGWLLARVADR